MTNQPTHSISFQKVAHFLIVVVILTYILIIGKDILVPLVLAVLLAFMLKPICASFERQSVSRTLAVFMTLVLAAIPVVVASWFFGMQLQKVFSEFSDITAGISEGVEELSVGLSDFFNLPREQAVAIIDNGVDSAVEAPIGYLSMGLAMSTSFLLRISLTIIYLVIFLIYRTAFKRFIMQQFGGRDRDQVYETMSDVEHVAKDYFKGMLTVMLILGVLNTIGLHFIGLDYAPLWGFLAAALALIPYIGTILGGMLPFLYSFASGDGYWQPVQIIILYSFIQFLEGNFITPKVVGKSVNINPLFAILALFIGEAIWGLVGMVVALPLLAILRITLDRIESWRPVALLLSDDLYQKSELYQQEYDEPRFRLARNFLKKSFLEANPPHQIGDGQSEIISQPETK